MKRIALWMIVVALVIGGAAWWLTDHSVPIHLPRRFAAGDAMDSLDHVVVYCNGGMGATHGRNVVGGYNVGLKYQCVEFVKRYYLEHFHHRMPNSYGHAKDLFDTAIADGALNPARGLLQFRNNGRHKPAIGDLVVLDGWRGNPYGHVAIIARVEDDEVQVIQQNTGSSRATYDLEGNDGRWRIDSDRVLGWLRMRDHWVPPGGVFIRDRSLPRSSSVEHGGPRA